MSRTSAETSRVIRRAAECYREIGIVGSDYRDRAAELKPGTMMITPNGLEVLTAAGWAPACLAPMGARL